MNNINMREVSEDFAACWRAAGLHLQEQGQGSLKWLRAHLAPPFLEHLSFRIGNQLFFVRVEAADASVESPGSIDGLFEVANACKGHACLMPMFNRSGGWRCAAPGWGLLDAKTEKILNPISLATEEKIEMTDWELQDFAVLVVRNDIEKSGKRLMSWQSDPRVNPSIWFEGDKGPEWVVVRSARWPERDAEVPRDIDQIAASCAPTGKIGHFAVVGAANANDPFDPQAKLSGNYVPLIRGEGINVNYGGLKLIVSNEPSHYTPPTDLSLDLINEFVRWFDLLLEKGTVLPKFFTGVNRDGKQFLVDMSLVKIDSKKHFWFMRYVLFNEKSIAYAYKMRMIAQLCEEPLIHQEQHVFYSGSSDSYSSVVLTSQSADGWQEGSKLVSEDHTAKPEIFLQELLPEFYERTDDDDMYANIWNSIRDKVIWRDRPLAHSSV